VSQGGAYQKAQTIAILDPSAKKLGITIKPGQHPRRLARDQIAGCQRQADLGRGRRATGYCLRGGEQGLVEKLDFSKLPNGAAMPEAYRSLIRWPTSSIRACWPTVRRNSRRRRRPTAGPIFWDVKKFPGRRALRNHRSPRWEAALMADGVAPDKLYPLDVDRAFKKLEEIQAQHHGVVDLGRAIRTAP